MMIDVHIIFFILLSRCCHSYHLSFRSIHWSVTQNHKKMKTASLLTAFLMALWGVEAFVTTQPTSFGVIVAARSDTTTTTTTSLQMTVLTYKGKKKNFPPGSPLSKACASLGVPVKYSCRKYVGALARLKPFQSNLILYSPQSSCLLFFFVYLKGRLRHMPN